MWLNKLERKYGKYAISNLTLYLIIGYVIGYVVSVISPDLLVALQFNPYAIIHGQVWRIFTWLLLIPRDTNIIFVAIMLFFYYQLGNALENTWGTFKYNVYIFSGILFTIFGAIITYFGIIMVGKGQLTQADYQILPSYAGQLVGAAVSTYYITTSIFLAFAAIYPDMQVMLYFVIPLKIKWLGILYAIGIGVDIVFSPWPVKAVIIFSLLNFLVFFFTTRNYARINPSNIKRKQEYRKKIREAHKNTTYENGARHKCAICGRTELDDPNLTFRYCSKCSGGREYCQDHLFTHEHK